MSWVPGRRRGVDTRLPSLCRRYDPLSKVDSSYEVVETASGCVYGSLRVGSIVVRSLQDTATGHGW